MLSPPMSDFAQGAEPEPAPLHANTLAAFDRYVKLTEAKLGDVLGMLKDYDKHSVYYAPDVERSKTESRNGDHFRVFLRFRRHKVITVVLDTEHEIEYFRDAPERAHSRSSAVRIAE